MKKILAVAHQYGGANVLSPVIKKLQNFSGIEIITLGYGFSADSFQKAGIEFSVPEVLYNFYDGESIELTASKIIDFEKPDILLCGTSDGFNLEKAIVSETRNMGIPSMGILDNWTNLDKRFCSDNSVIDSRYIPSFLCIMDNYCHNELTKIGYDSSKMGIFGHPYLEELFNSYSTFDNHKLKKNMGITPESRIITFISEPHSEDYGENENNPNYKGFTEFDVLKCLTSSMNYLVIKEKINVFLIIKLHPKEKEKDYSSILNKAIFQHKTIYNEYHLELFNISDIVIGMESIFLVESAMFGIPTISLQLSLRDTDTLFSNKLGLTIPIYHCESLYTKLLSLLKHDETKTKSSYLLEYNSAQLITKLVLDKLSKESLK